MIFEKFYDQVKLNEYGFYQLINKPTRAELEDYYEKKYYQEDNGNYRQSYSDEELLYIRNKLEQKYFVIEKELKQQGKRTFLEIGCGEGWALRFFEEKGFETQGLDYSSHGCKIHNEALVDKIKKGNIEESIIEIIKSGKKYDLVLLDNVLEHVINPGDLLKSCFELCTDSGILIIEVPNDFSVIQEKLLDEGHIENAFWLAIPDHISYFNLRGLEKLALNNNWDMFEFMADYPVDFNLFNENTNYVRDRNKGKEVHKSRLYIENIFHSISVGKTTELFKVMADMGIGRQIIGFFKKHQVTQ